MIPVAAAPRAGNRRRDTIHGYDGLLVPCVRDEMVNRPVRTATIESVTIGHLKMRICSDEAIGGKQLAKFDICRALVVRRRASPTNRVLS